MKQTELAAVPMTEPRKDSKDRIYPVPKGPPEGGWSTLPKRGSWKRPHAAKDPPPGAAHTGGAITPLEILGRLAGGTTFREPNAPRGSGGQSLSNDDIAHALGFVHDPLAQRLALAIACQTAAEWTDVQRLAAPLLRKQLTGNHTTRGMVHGANRYRIRLVLHDVFHDLVLLRRPRAPSDAAELYAIPERDYRALYKQIAGFVETSAQTGAYIACRVLFGPA